MELIPSLILKQSIFFSPLFFLVLILPFSLLFLFFKQTKSSNLPPGPRPWPIIGNILQLAEKPHIVTASLARVHGPLMTLRLGTELLIVASSPRAAMEILKVQDAKLSSRFVPHAYHHRMLPFSLIWSRECDEHWKSLRTLCKSDIFSVRAMEAQAAMREEKVRQMVGFLDEASMDGKVVKIGDVVFGTVFNMISNIMFSKDLLDLKEEVNSGVKGLKGRLFGILDTAFTPNIGDFFPIIDSLDIQGIRRKSLKQMEDYFKVWESCVKDRRAKTQLDNSSQKQADTLDRLIEAGVDDDQIDTLTMELYIAGTDTVTSTLEWAMTELVKNKEALSKVEEELKREIDPNSSIESQLSKLLYLHACVKETLRLHPPAPFLLPHRAPETCEIMGYTVPKDAQILVNVYAIGRDPSIWNDPLAFKPERFIDSNVDFKGQDFELIPFGAGRRMCPGLPSGTKSVHLILASLIHRFDLKLANNEDPSELDMNEHYGGTSHKENPLQLILKRK